MKKILATLLVLSFAGSVIAAETYTESVVNKWISPVTQKEKQLQQQKAQENKEKWNNKNVKKKESKCKNNAKKKWKQQKELTKTKWKKRKKHLKHY